MKQYLIAVTVLALVEWADRNGNDQEDDPTGTRDYRVDADRPEDAIELALDIFHSTVPIKVLDDFEIRAQVKEPIGEQDAEYQLVCPDHGRSTVRGEGDGVDVCPDHGVVEGTAIPLKEYAPYVFGVERYTTGAELAAELRDWFWEELENRKLTIEGPEGYLNLQITVRLRENKGEHPGKMFRAD